jgi:hypothetical protein
MVSKKESNTITDLQGYCFFQQQIAAVQYMELMPNADTQRRVGHLIISFVATKLPPHPEDGDVVRSHKIGKPSHL